MACRETSRAGPNVPSSYPVAIPDPAAHATAVRNGWSGPTSVKPGSSAVPGYPARRWRTAAVA